MNAGHTHEAIAATLRKAGAALNAADVPFMLGGSVACWARGGPRSQNDVDIFVKPQDAERAVGALVEAGMRAERPPEQWLFKAWDGEVMVDVIFESLGVELSDEAIERAEEMPVLGVNMRVLAVEDVLAGKLLAVTEQNLEYGGLLEIARALREQVSWQELWDRTRHSPYARTFFVLLAELGVIELESDPERAQRPYAWRSGRPPVVRRGSDGPS